MWISDEKNLTKIPARAIFCGIASTVRTKYINAATTFILKLNKLMKLYVFYCEFFLYKGY